MATVMFSIFQLFDIATLKFWPWPKFEGQGQWGEKGTCPFDWKCQHLIFAKIWPVLTIVTDRQTYTHGQTQKQAYSHRRTLAFLFFKSICFYCSNWVWEQFVHLWTSVKNTLFRFFEFSSFPWFSCIFLFLYRFLLHLLRTNCINRVFAYFVCFGFCCWWCVLYWSDSFNPLTVELIYLATWTKHSKPISRLVGLTQAKR